MAYIRDIPSDTTVDKILIKSSQELVIFLTLYTEEKRKIVFEGFEAINVFSRWSCPEVIEGLQVNENSELLETTLKILKNEGMQHMNLKSYKFLLFDRPVVEVIAREFKIVELK